MREKLVIRIRRKNEFNPYWASLMLMSVILVAVLFMIEDTFQGILLTSTALIILFVAILYQGFEVVKG